MKRPSAAAVLLLGLSISAAAGPHAAAAPDPSKTALLIVDIQNFYFPGGRLPLVGPAEAALQARRVLDACRAFNELVLALIFIAMVGLGPFAGALALALHTTGVLGRLFAQAIDNAARAPALRGHQARPCYALDCWIATMLDGRSAVEPG